METDNKILISAVLIIGIAIFASFLNTGLSGRATSDCEPPSAIATPKSGPAGSEFMISVSGYYSNPVDITRCSDGSIVETFTRTCIDDGTSNTVCKNGGEATVKTLSRDVSTVWQDGFYCVRVRDLCSRTSDSLMDRVTLSDGKFEIRGSIGVPWGNVEY